MTPHEITESVEIDQFDLPFAQAWVESALQRGFIAKTGGSNASTRYNIMPAWAERGPRYHRTLRC